MMDASVTGHHHHGQAKLSSMIIKLLIRKKLVILRMLKGLLFCFFLQLYSFFLKIFFSSPSKYPLNSVPYWVQIERSERIIFLFSCRSLEVQSWRKSLPSSLTGSAFPLGLLTLLSTHSNHHQKIFTSYQQSVDFATGLYKVPFLPIPFSFTSPLPPFPCSSIPFPLPSSLPLPFFPIPFPFSSFFPFPFCPFSFPFPSSPLDFLPLQLDSIPPEGAEGGSFIHL